MKTFIKRLFCGDDVFPHNSIWSISVIAIIASFLSMALLSCEPSAEELAAQAAQESQRVTDSTEKSKVPTLLQVKYQCSLDTDTIFVNFPYTSIYLEQGDIKVTTGGGTITTTIASGVRIYKIVASEDLLKIGMTTEEVRELFGEPEEKSSTVSRFGNETQWTYGKKRLLFESSVLTRVVE